MTLLFNVNLMHLQLPMKGFYKMNASCQKRQQTDIKTTWTAKERKSKNQNSVKHAKDKFIQIKDSKGKKNLHLHPVQVLKQSPHSLYVTPSGVPQPLHLYRLLRKGHLIYDKSTFLKQDDKQIVLTWILFRQKDKLLNACYTIWRCFVNCVN